METDHLPILLAASIWVAPYTHAWAFHIKNQEVEVAIENKTGEAFKRCGEKSPAAKCNKLEPRYANVLQERYESTACIAISVPFCVGR
jgi:hypothetical protein